MFSGFLGAFQKPYLWRSCVQERYKAEACRMQMGLEGVEVPQRGALSDLCPPREEPRKEGANRAPLASVLRERGTVESLQREECPQGGQS